MDRITAKQGIHLPHETSDFSKEMALTDESPFRTLTREQVAELCSSGDTSKTSKILADGKIQRQYGKRDDGSTYICESHPGRGYYQRLMTIDGNSSEVQSITELLQAENLSVKRNFSGKNSISLNSESIEPFDNYHPKEERRYSLNQDGHTVSLIEQDLFDGLIKIKHDPTFKSKEVKIGDEIYKIDLNPEQTTSYKIPSPKGESQDFEITVFKPMDYSNIPDQEISPQMKVRFNDKGEINVYNADDKLLTKYTSQGDRIDYDLTGNINMVIAKNGTLYQFQESQPYNKSKADGVFIAYEHNSEEAAKKVFKTGPGRDIAIYDEKNGKAVITADTSEL
ncbi:MAG: hypothetical protein ACKO3R_03585 [bacterium]